MLQKDNIRAQQGIVLPLMVVALLTLVGFMGLALDVAYVYLVRNELQNAADAAALAGAGKLFSGSSSIADFAVASAAANSAISLLNNTAANAPLVTGTISSGYWNLTGSPLGLHASSLGANDFPAVEVQISKDGANGPVTAFFSQVLGITTFNPMAKAVAVVTGPGTATLFPLAVSDCLFSASYWDATTNSPVLATTTIALPGQGLAQTIGLPYVFELNSTTDSPFGLPATCNSGVWTSFNISPPSTSTIANFISHPVQATLNDFIYIYSGTKVPLYKALPSGVYIAVPVVSNTDLNTGTSPTNIVAFACIYISNVVTGGSNKYLVAQLVAMGNANCKIPSGSGYGNINYGLLQPPRLVNYWGNTY